MKELRQEIHDMLVELAAELEVGGLLTAAEKMRRRAIDIQSGGGNPPKPPDD